MRVVLLARAACVSAAIAAGLAGCSRTNLTNLWKNPEAGAPLGNLLVVTLDRDADVQRLWEDAITAEFQAYGVMARPSYSLFPASLPDSQQLAVVARRDHYDGVVVTHRLAPTHTTSFDSDYAKRAPAGSGDYWRGWYHTHYMAVTQAPPTAASNDDARFQIDLASAAGHGTLMWTASTTPLKPRDTEKLQAEVCGQLVSELMRQGFVARRD